jgi:ADP-heptose:LPS heptosyltransferase
MTLSSWLSRWFGPAPEVKNPQSIFIGMIGGVGDLVLASPSVTALHNKFPHAQICFGVGPHPFYSTIKNHPHIHRFETPFSYNVWKSGDRRALERRKCREYDRVLLLDNPDRDWWKQGKHLIDIYAEKCGVVLPQRRGVIHLSSDDEEQGREILHRNGIAPEDFLVVMAPEVRSKREVKEWPHGHFIRLIERIHAHKRVKIIAFVSPQETREYPGTIVLRDPIGPSAAVIRSANAFIGLDCGLTHIAGALNVKIVSIHIGFPPQCSAVLSDNAVIVAHEPFCRPDSISVEEVFEKVQTIL